MLSSLSIIFDDLDLSTIDSLEDLANFRKYFELLKIFPNLEKIFQAGKDKDETEFLRTIKHILRTIKIYFLLRKGSIFHETLSKDSLQQISAKIKALKVHNELLIPLILVYHDIGRFIDKKSHPLQSSILISEKDLLNPFNLLDIEKILVKKIIQYHLLFATIFTGESTFYGIHSLIHDEEFAQLLNYENFSNTFVDLLEIFTYIDILGYPYAKVFDHYLKYFNEISRILKNLLNFWPDRKIILEKAFEFSQKWIDWRIAGGLRCFQFVETKPYLTREFYFNKLKESVKEISRDLVENLEWEAIKKKYLTLSCKIQIKYGLAFLMILAFGDFFRSRMKEEVKISHKLILFWILLSKEIKTREKSKDPHLWNVYFQGAPNWLRLKKDPLKEFDNNALESFIKDLAYKEDERKGEINIFLDLRKIFN